MGVVATGEKKCYIIILWDHRRIRSPSLTETSLCGTYLYPYFTEVHKAFELTRNYQE